MEESGEGREGGKRDCVWRKGSRGGVEYCRRRRWREYWREKRIVESSAPEMEVSQERMRGRNDRKKKRRRRSY